MRTLGRLFEDTRCPFVTHFGNFAYEPSVSVRTMSIGIVYGSHSAWEHLPPLCAHSVSLEEEPAERAKTIATQSVVTSKIVHTLLQLRWSPMAMMRVA